MTFNKALGVGLVVATVLHALVFHTGHLSSPFLFPGFIAHFLITGLHGDDGILGTVASIVEVLINAVLYALLISSASHIVRRVKRLG